MPAPLGNQFWKLADWGKPKAYQPDDLWEKACDYFEWCESNPWNKNEAIKGGDAAGTIMQIPTERPFTIHAFCIFAGIVTKTFWNYEQDEAYLPICTRIREIIYSQKFEGAVVGAFNANIIARDLGLSDKSELKHLVQKGVLNIDPLADDTANEGDTENSQA
jgi:hypothetical protein